MKSHEKNFENLLKLGKHFIKALKKSGLYHNFLIKYKRIDEHSNVPNLNGALFDAMMKDVMNLVRMDLSHRGKKIETTDEYEYYTNILNMLIHKYVERGMNIRPERCAKLGEGIFNSFCIDIFGEEKFKKDMEAFNAIHDSELNLNIEELKQQYTSLSRMGLNVTWEEFLKFHRNTLKQKRMARQEEEQMIQPMDSSMYYSNSPFEPFWEDNEEDEDDDENIPF